MKSIAIFVTIMLACLDVCAQYQTNYLSSTATTITVRAVGHGRNSNKATIDAEHNALLAILYNGFERATYSSALITELRDDVEKTNYNYFRNFWNSEYRQFIQSSIVTQPFAKDSANNKCIVLDITINHKALRENLEKNGVIRKFGF